MHKTIAAAALAALLTVPVAAQAPAPTSSQTGAPTAGELLQKGIFAQETAGDLDGAIKIYRQIVDSHPVEREIAAQAQYRLGMTLLQKGDAAVAAQEIQRLGWDFPNYKELIDAAKKAGSMPLGQAGGVFGFGTYSATNPRVRHEETFQKNEARLKAKWELSIQDQNAADADRMKRAALDAQHDQEFDSSKVVTVTGTVAQVEWVNPNAWLSVNVPSLGLQRVSLDSSGRFAPGGIATSVNLGDEVTVTGYPARDGSQTMQATSVSVAGKVVFTRAAGGK